MAPTGFLHASTPFLRDAVAQLRVRGALTSGLWLVIVVSVILLPAAYAFQPHPWILGLLIGVVVVVILVVLAAFLYLIVKNPDRLQSEQYQVQAQALNIIGITGPDAPRMPASQLHAIAQVAGVRPLALAPRSGDDGRASALPPVVLPAPPVAHGDAL